MLKITTVTVVTITIKSTCVGEALTNSALPKLRTFAKGDKSISTHWASVKKFPPLKQSMYLYTVEGSALKNTRQWNSLIQNRSFSTWAW